MNELRELQETNNMLQAELDRLNSRHHNDSGSSQTLFSELYQSSHSSLLGPEQFGQVSACACVCVCMHSKCMQQREIPVYKCCKLKEYSCMNHQHTVKIPCRSVEFYESVLSGTLTHWKTWNYEE